MTEPIFLGPWSGKQLTRAEAVRECWDRVRLAEPPPYRIRRRWIGMRSGCWEPTADELASRAEWLETGRFG